MAITWATCERSRISASPSRAAALPSVHGRLRRLGELLQRWRREGNDCLPGGERPGSTARIRRSGRSCSAPGSERIVRETACPNRVTAAARPGGPTKGLASRDPQKVRGPSHLSFTCVLLGCTERLGRGTIARIYPCGTAGGQSPTAPKLRGTVRSPEWSRTTVANPDSKSHRGVFLGRFSCTLPPNLRHLVHSRGGAFTLVERRLCPRLCPGLSPPYRRPAGRATVSRPAR